MRICLYGGPGLGKSTLAAEIFAALKKEGLNVELVREYIKNWAYLDRRPKSFEQTYIFAKQMHAEDLLLHSGVPHIVTDSPLYLQCYYSHKYNFPCWKELVGICTQFEREYPAFNIFLGREGIPYKEEGRWENYEQAVAVDKEMRDFVTSCGIECHDFNAVNLTAILSLYKSLL